MWPLPASGKSAAQPPGAIGRLDSLMAVQELQKPAMSYEAGVRFDRLPCLVYLPASV